MAEQRRRWSFAAVGPLAIFPVLIALMLTAVAVAAPVTKFVSKRYGYSIVLPGKPNRWRSSLATVNWTSKSIGGVGSPEIDTFTDLKTNRSYLLAARPSKSLRRWTGFVVTAHPRATCGKAHFLPNSTLDGSRARVHTVSCTDGYKVFVITALRAERGYMLLVASPTNLSRSSDLRAFNSARRTFRFLH